MTDSEVRCPLEFAYNMFGGKWKPRILCVLSTKGTMRFNELRDELCNISNKVLSSSLKELVTDGLVVRNESDQQAYKVEYTITPKGQSVIPILLSICEWSGMFRKEGACGGNRICLGCDHADP